jgi:hypothetical protein
MDKNDYTLHHTSAIVLNGAVVNGSIHASVVKWPDKSSSAIYQQIGLGYTKQEHTRRFDGIKVSPGSQHY